MTLNVVPGTIYHMDNLDALRGMNSSIIDLIATDPPFNTGRNRESVGGKYVDQWRWEENVHRSWMDDIRDTNRPLVEVIEAAEHAHSENLGAFLCFLGVRLIEMKRVLKDTGSIYVHLDPTASHYVKGIMDAVFGARNFRNEIVWKRTSGRSDAKKFGAIHDTILYYSKGDSPTWNPIHLPHDPEYVKKFYRHDDGDGRGPWRSADLTAAGLRSGLSGASWRGVNPGKVGRHWGTPTGGGMYEYIIKNNIIPGWPDAYPTVPDRLDALDAAGLIHSRRDEGHALRSVGAEGGLAMLGLRVQPARHQAQSSLLRLRPHQPQIRRRHQPPRQSRRLVRPVQRPEVRQTHPRRAPHRRAGWPQAGQCPSD